MKFLRLFLLAGLVFHKLVWEVLKKRNRVPAGRRPSRQPILKSIVKAAKSSVLAFLVFQTIFLNLFPISKRPARLRIAGVAIYLAGLATAVLGRLQLGDNWSNIEDAQVLSDQSLVTSGMYSHIRHPIYAGDILLLTGLELALNSWLVLGVCVPLLVVLRNVAKEEATLSQAFPGYDAYRARTKRFVPFVL